MSKRKYSKKKSTGSKFLRPMLIGMVVAAIPIGYMLYKNINEPEDIKMFNNLKPEPNQKLIDHYITSIQRYRNMTTGMLDCYKNILSLDDFEKIKNIDFDNLTNKDSEYLKTVYYTLFNYDKIIEPIITEIHNINAYYNTIIPKLSSYFTVNNNIILFSQAETIISNIKETYGIIIGKKDNKNNTGPAERKQKIRELDYNSVINLKTQIEEICRLLKINNALENY